MKNKKLLAGIFLAVNLLAVCAAVLLFSVSEDGRPFFAQNRNDADDSAAAAPADPGEIPVLNPALLSLLDGDNAAVRQNYYGRCYAEVTLRGNFSLTYFTPYLDIHFEPEGDSADGWRQAGDTDGFYDENPLVDSLSVTRIDLCEEIDPKGPSLLGTQDSMRQLIQTTQPITYELLCTVLEQTPELIHRDNVFYDASHVFDDPEARGSAEERAHRIGERVTGGEEVAVFVVDDVKIDVSFIRVEDETLAFYMVMEKK